jgi:hypothetical protein
MERMIYQSIKILGGRKGKQLRKMGISRKGSQGA